MRSRKKKGLFGIASQLVECEKSNEELKDAVLNCEQEKTEIVRKYKDENAKLVAKNIMLTQQNAILVNENLKMCSANVKLKKANARLQTSNIGLMSMVNGINHAEIALKQLVDKRLVSAESLEKIVKFREKFMDTMNETASIAVKITAIEADLDKLKIES